MAFDASLPADVDLRSEAPPRETDPTLGVARAAIVASPDDAPPGGAAVNRMVTVGDSLTHGFKSGGVAEPHFARPTLVASRLGFAFRFPFFNAPPICPGLPVNLEKLIVELEKHHGGRLLPLYLPLVLPHYLKIIREVDDYWDRGEGFQIPQQAQFNHNLAIYGWDLRDALSKSRGVLSAQLKARPPQPHLYRPGVAEQPRRGGGRHRNAGRRAGGE